jgi:hypothetical protein
MRKTAALTCLFGALCTPAAMAQNANQPVIGERHDPPLHVNVNLTLFKPGPTGDSEEANKLRDELQRSFLAVAARECDVLREVIAKDCRLESLNVNINGNRGMAAFGQGQTEGHTVQGQMSFQVTPK